MDHSGTRPEPGSPNLKMQILIPAFFFFFFCFFFTKNVKMKLNHNQNSYLTSISMVKTNIIKTKKNRKKMLIFLIFFTKHADCSGILLLKKFFSQKIFFRKNKNFLHNYKKIFFCN